MVEPRVPDALVAELGIREVDQVRVVRPEADEDKIGLIVEHLPKSDQPLE